MSDNALYGGHDPRDLPAYSAAEASRLLQLPGATVRTWAYGNRRSDPVLTCAIEPKALSFNHLIELHVLATLRRARSVPLARIRAALRELVGKYSHPRPLLTAELYADNGRVFIEHMGRYLDVSARSQMVMRQVLEARLARIERDERSLAARFYPWAQRHGGKGLGDAPRSIIVDPRISWGRPTFVDTNVPVEEVVARFSTGESIADLADDFELGEQQVQDALRLYMLAA